MVSWGFPWFSSVVRQTPGDRCTAAGIISLSPKSLSDRLDWRETWCKWPLARNPDRRWKHRHTSIRLFGRGPWLYVSQGEEKKIWVHKFQLTLSVAWPRSYCPDDCSRFQCFSPEWINKFLNFKINTGNLSTVKCVEEWKLIIKLNPSRDSEFYLKKLGY